MSPGDSVQINFKGKKFEDGTEQVVFAHDTDCNFIIPVHSEWVVVFHAKASGTGRVSVDLR
jgi:acyl-CoA hydrolase